MARDVEQFSLLELSIAGETYKSLGGDVIDESFFHSLIFVFMVEYLEFGNAAVVNVIGLSIGEGFFSAHGASV